MTHFGRHNSHVSGDIRSTLRTPSRFWNITGYAKDIETIRNTKPTDVQKSQAYEGRLHDAIHRSFDSDKFEKDVCAEINKQLDGAEWEFILVDVLRQLNPHFIVKRVGGREEAYHGTDILMVPKPVTGLGLFDNKYAYDSPYAIAIQVKDWHGEVGNEVIDQINKADRWKETGGFKHVHKVVILTNATKEKNQSLVSNPDITFIFQPELNKMLAKYAKQQLGETDG